MRGQLLLFDTVRRQIEQLIPMFGILDQTSDILDKFDTLCTDSLNIDVRGRAPEFSRINTDGTPFQFSLSLNRSGLPAFQFLGEPGRPGCNMEERHASSFVIFEELANALGVTEEAKYIANILCRIVPKLPRDLPVDVSGILWFGLSFSPCSAPTLTIYANTLWGAETSQWLRLSAIAEFFNSTGYWHLITPLATRGLSPLGVSFSLSPNRCTKGRIYLRAYGQPLDVYRKLFLTSAPDQDGVDAFEAFGRQMLRDDAGYPTRSAVFSIELPALTMLGTKFELCAHCAFSHDAEASDRILAWLQDAGFDDQIYRSTVLNLTHGRQLSTNDLPSLHAYVGVGVHNSEPYASVYLNPGPALEYL